MSVADGTRTRFADDISAVAMLDSKGGLARWRWSDETLPFMARALPRSYCCQYRETDLDFVRRLLAEEGLNWRMEQDADGPGAVIFADSVQLSAVLLDASAALDGGIRFHGVRAGERQDTVQALHAQRRLVASLTTVLSYDYKAKQAVAASAPSRLAAGAKLPPFESYDVLGQYAYANGEQAQRYADLQMESREARSQLWRGRSTVRTLRAGTRLTVLGAPGERLGESANLTILRVCSVGVNNLPAPAVQALAELFGPIPELLEEVLHTDAPADLALAIAQARSTGYANCFEAVAIAVPWRPQLPGSDGRTHPAPTARGAQSAIVIGADGSDAPAGADELYCDKLGRVRLRFHWQDSAAATCWVRVAQRSAGGGMGSQFLPRIGQEVLVQFIENDIDRPIIVGALYNGQGEGGITPTPGGEAAGEALAGVFDPAHDHAPSAQGNLAAGNSPLWHGASGDSAGHRNGAAQWGMRSKEFGGAGYNQLLFDDTDAQGRVQLKSSHAASELSLGHLIHAADNYRGSLRGQGAELRTDDWGAVRAGAGLLVTSFGVSHTPTAREPAGDNTAGIALMKQAVQVAKTFSEAATTHRTVAFAAHAGATKANASTLDANAAPLPALLAAVSGMVDQDSLDGARSDAAAMNTTPADGKLPYTTAPIIAVAAKGALAVSAADSVQIAAGETVTLMSGHDTQFVSGGQLRMHSGQAIGLLGGIVKAEEGEIGVQLIAAAGGIEVEAQSSTLAVQARDEVNVISANAHVEWAAAKSISLSTAGGANITIAGGNITIQCPGKITIHAGVKSFTGPTNLSYPLPLMPQSICVECLLKARASGSPFVMR